MSERQKNIWHDAFFTRKPQEHTVDCVQDRILLPIITTQFKTMSFLNLRKLVFWRRLRAADLSPDGCNKLNDGDEGGRERQKEIVKFTSKMENASVETCPTEISSLYSLTISIGDSCSTRQKVRRHYFDFEFAFRGRYSKTRKRNLTPGFSKPSGICSKVFSCLKKLGCPPRRGNGGKLEAIHSSSFGCFVLQLSDSFFFPLFDFTNRRVAPRSTS